MSLSTKIKTAIMVGMLAIVGVGAILAQPAYASDCKCPTKGEIEGMKRTDGSVNWDTWRNSDAGKKCSAAEQGMCIASDGTNTSLDLTAKNIINGVLYVVGLLAVVMVIVGGVQYTTSGGDQAKVTKAKNTILYGVVGLVIAILAYAIVNFVIGRIGTKQSEFDPVPAVLITPKSF